MEIKQIVLITSGQPALNPRLVKEADALTAAGYQVKVLYQYWNNWGTALDKVLLQHKKWEVIRVGGAPDQKKFTYLLSKLIFKLGKLVVRLTGNGVFSNLALGRCTWLLIKEARKHNAHLYIAHNLAALPAAIEAAKKYNAKCGFDAEDFHRNEVSNDPAHPDVQLKTFIENKYFRKLDYLTAASDLIGQHYKQLYPQLDPVTILNVFPLQVIEKQETASSGSLKLCWFSQTVGKGRGLEEIIAAIGKLKVLDIELHLLGNCDEAIKSHFEAVANQAGADAKKIIYYQPVPPDEVFSFASKFDIGLAIETGDPLNRDICLTNKIFTYLIAGIAVIATKTSAQQAFLEKYPSIGKLYKIGDTDTLSQILSTFYHDSVALEQAKLAASQLAKQELNWEHEQTKLLSRINEI